jgi:hypothetical protein
MNCDEFERTIIDFSGDHLTDASAHDLALVQAAQKHTESCAGCAARLKREELITAGLQALAIEESTIRAPERVLAALRAAFDKQPADAAAQPVLPQSPRRKWLWGMAAAAMLLVSAVTTAFWLRDQRAAVSGTVNAVPLMAMSQSQLKAAGQEVQLASEIHPSDVAKSPSRQIRRRKPPVTDSADDPGEFFPLTYVAKSGPTEFVQRVHVEISRSTLLSMGVPVNIERGEGLIKAEIIIGEDGVARAVRIIN